jgi:hypothetical protein
VASPQIFIDPQYKIYCHRYPTRVSGCDAIAIDKQMYPNIESLSFDGRSYSKPTEGICTLGFAHDISDRILLGDYVVVVKSVFEDEDVVSKLGSVIENIKRVGTVGMEGRVIFQGFVIANNWSQAASLYGLTSNFNLVLADITTLFSDNTLFGVNCIKNSKPGEGFETWLKRDYGIDLDKIYRRDELVNKLVKGFIKNRIQQEGGILSGEALAKMFSGGSTVLQNLGIQFDGAIDAFDFVKARTAFKVMNPSVNAWKYLQHLAAPPLYECFIREDSGRLVFRRSAWDKVGSLVSKVLNAASLGGLNNSATLRNADNFLNLNRSQSYTHTLYQGQITACNIHQTTRGMKNVVSLSRSGDKMGASRLDDSYINRYGLQTQTFTPNETYNPELNSRSRELSSAIKDALTSLPNLIVGRVDKVVDAIERGIKGVTGMGGYSPLSVQDEILRKSVADIFRGELVLRTWYPIAIGDHVKIASSDLFSFGIPAEIVAQLSKANTGFIGYTARNEDFLFYVTGKTFKAVASENGSITETLKLRINYGGLEFVDTLSPGSLTIIHDKS